MRLLPPSRAALRVAAVLLAACGGSDAVAPPVNPPPVTPTPLRTLMAQRSRYIGAATGGTFQRADATGITLRTVLAREFNMVWSGNFLKFSVLRPDSATFQFQWADSMVAFAQAHGMTVRGHVFVWHNQLPPWLTAATRDSAEADSILADHIGTVMSRYAGTIGIWDVVNEAFDDAALPRTTFWSTALGPGYIERAFRIAHAALPAAELYYNDYNIEGLGAKSDAVYGMLADLRARGVPVHGIGMQGHFVAGALPSDSSLLANFARFAALGLRIQVTELDVRVPLPATPQSLAQQASDYRRIFSVCLLTPACNAVELAGVYDGDTWVPGTFPGWGAPLLYNETFAAKPAYTAVKDLLEGT